MRSAVVFVIFIFTTAPAFADQRAGWVTALGLLPIVLVAAYVGIVLLYKEIKRLWNYWKQKRGS
jgi:hypothetical protein